MTVVCPQCGNVGNAIRVITVVEVINGIFKTNHKLVISHSQRFFDYILCSSSISVQQLSEEDQVKVLVAFADEFKLPHVRFEYK